MRDKINYKLISYLMNTDLIRTALYGKLYNPAYTAYSLTPTKINCDNCNSSGINEAIHYAQYDLCKSCCLKLRNIAKSMDNIPEPCPNGVCKPRKQPETIINNDTCSNGVCNPETLINKTDPNISRMMQDRDNRRTSHMGVNFDRETEITRHGKNTQTENGIPQNYSKRGDWESYFN
jgi:hypothetical protein